MKKTKAILSIIGVFLIISLTGISAQETGTENKTPTVGEADKNSDSVELSKEGEVKVEGDSAYLAEAGKFHIGKDPTIWIMIILANLALVVTVERWWHLRKTKGNHAELMTLLSEKLSDETAITPLISKQIETGFGLSGKVASLALKGWIANEKAIAEYAQSGLIGERRDMEKRLVILSTLGNNIPFIGLLGTVLGIMKAFRDLAMMGEAGPSVVMKGISEALIATAMGLAIAVPCVIAYNVLSRIVKDRVSQAEEVVTLIRGLKISGEKNFRTNVELETRELG
jgi:biopolymer transport protein ExbB